jgi:amino acid adenylation domain-containing protein
MIAQDSSSPVRPAGSGRSAQSADVYLIGRTSLLRNCALELLKDDFSILGIFTNDPEIIDWAFEGGIAVHRFDDAVTVLKRRPYDYLFSIVNPVILKADALCTAGRGVFNYHDSLLPRYAGVHATSWALLNQEKVHGISWHHVTEGIDTGAIMRQREIPIGRHETAFTLNARCYEAALEEFRLLLPRLKSGLWQEQSRPQNGETRSYFGLHQKPPAGGLLDLEAPAESIEAQVRALDFGTTRNTLALASLWIGKDQLLVGQAQVLDRRSSASAGTLLALDGDTADVATATFDLRLSKLRGVTRDDIPLAELFATNDLGPGSKLPSLTDEFKRFYRDQLQASSRHESRWVEELQKVNALTLPPSDTGGSGRASATALLEDLHPGFDADHSLVAIFLLYLARLLNSYRFSVGVRRPLQRPMGEWNPFTEVTPLTLALDRADTLLANTAKVSAAVTSHLNRKTYTKDIFKRYPELAGSRVPPFPVVLAPAPARSDQSPLCLEFDRNRLVLSWDQEQVGARLAAKLGEFPAWLKQLNGEAAARPLSAVTVLSERDLAEQLIEWTDTARPLPEDAPVHGLFEEQAHKNPNAVAVSCRKFRFSYRELNERAERLAVLLRHRGVGVESRVGVCLERSSELLVAIFAILKSGATYVPLDPNYPAERMEFIVGDAELEAVITTERHRGRFERLGVATIDIGEGVAFFSPPANPVRVGADNAAYIIYTSGSTGRPKGIAIPHRGAVSLLTWVKACLGRELQSVLCSTSVCFDLSIVELVGPLVAGGSCVVVDNLLDWIESDLDIPVTLISSVPSIARELLPALAKDTPRAVRLREMLAGNLMAIALGGEAVTRSLVDAFHETFPGITVRDLYGPTEYSVLSTSGPRARGEVETIGRPLANAKVYILDDNLEPVLAGAVGELYVSGPGLARGYVRQPDLSAASFLPNPFGDGRHTRLYRTRDRCRFLDDGRIVYLGRTDNQVKIRGHRIELGEIEHVLNSHPDIEGSFSAIFKDKDGRSAIVAYLVSAKPLDIGAIREFLRRKLASYMVPQTFVQLKRLPLLPNGKVNRRALPAPALERPASAAFESPAGEIEIALAEIWCQVLRLDGAVGATDDFFSLGGQSLRAIEVLNRVKDSFGCRLTMGDLFEAPTIRAMAAMVSRTAGEDVPRRQSRSGTTPTTFAAAIEREDPEVCFMGPSQWPFWFAYHPEQFNVPVYIPIQTGAQRELVPGIVEALPRAFPLLTYRPGTFAPKLVKRPYERVPLLTVDLSSHRGRIEQADALRQFMSDCKRDFTRAATSPQLYAVLARVDEERSILALRYPHYHGDGYSNQLIEQRVLAWLGGRDERAVQPADFMSAIRQDERCLSIPYIERSKAFWKDLLAGASNTIVPGEWFSREVRKPRVLLDLNRDEIERFREQRGLLLRSLYLAALSYAFRELLSPESMIIRHFVAKEPERGAASSIYPRLFLEAYPIDFSTRVSNAAHIAQIHATTKQVLKGGDVALPLTMAGILSATPDGGPTWKETIAKTLGRSYGFFVGANELQARLLVESMSGFVRARNQVDVYLNIIPDGPALTRDATLQGLIHELKGRYIRQCSGHLLETFCLDVFEDGRGHRLSLDSPFSEEVDRRILGKIQEFLDYS